MNMDVLQSALAFGEIDIRGANDGNSVSRAGATYALL